MGRGENAHHFEEEEMMYTLILSKETEKDIQLAYRWYEEQSNGLGDKFIQSLEKAIISIQTNPQFYSYRKRNIRGCIIKGFPYVILFYITGSDNIRVKAVFHTSRK